MDEWRKPATIRQKPATIRRKPVTIRRKPVTFRRKPGELLISSIFKWSATFRRKPSELLISSIFKCIHRLLLDIQANAPWADQVSYQLRLLIMDIRFLIAFGLYIESRAYPTDEESRDPYWSYTTAEERFYTLESFVTRLRKEWPKELQIVSLFDRPIPLMRSWPIDKSFQDFHSANLELEEKIRYSKYLVYKWCGKMMRFSSMQYRSLSFFDIRQYLKDLHQNLKDFSRYRAENTVQLKKQIVSLLEDKILFLDKSLDKIKSYLEDGKEVRQVLNFIDDFTNSAACLACFYWAQGDDEESGPLSNVEESAFFDLMNKFIPYAYDLAPLYIAILKPYHLHQSDSLLLRDTVESFVDFFFEHLATFLMDDYLILRNHLIFLFTFLTDPPNENAEVEDLIRTQIYAFFHEDEYLRLSFDERKEEFSDKQMYSSFYYKKEDFSGKCDFMIETDIVVAKIRQLYSGFSGSWINLEVEKMKYVYFVSIQLSWIEKHAQWADSVWGQLQLYKMELIFLNVFLICFTTWNDTNEDITEKLTSIISSLQGIWGKEEENGLLSHRLHAIHREDIKTWQPLASELEGKIKLSKLEIKEWWVNVFHLSFRCRPSTFHKIVKFVDYILDKLRNIVTFKICEIMPFKKQVETMEEKLIFLKNLLKLTANCIDCKESEEFKMFVQGFANDAACLIFILWARDTNDETNSMISYMLQKIKPSTPDLARLYFKTLESLSLQRSDSSMFGHTILSFVDDLMTPLKDEFQILFDDIVFLLSFLNDCPNENAAELICSQIDVLFWEGVYGLLPFDDTGEDFSKKKLLLSDFMMKIGSVNANIRKTYGKFSHSSLCNFPKVTSPGFLDFLIKNLRCLIERMSNDHKYVPFAKYKIINIEEELVSLCPFFNHIFNLQSELNETWLEVVNLIYLTECVISECISSWFVYDRPIWYHMSYLSNILDEIKVVKTKLEKITENTMYNARCLPTSAGSSGTPSDEYIPLDFNEIVIGFEDEAEKIIDKLIGGLKPLDIVSIVGMGGLGKTTLAKKVYGTSLVKCNFHLFAFCSVSQNHNARRLLLDILRDIGGNDDRLTKMTDDDLKHKLWKCLSRQKYLIVLDDIWDTSAWNEVKSSFPNNNNGSRVMFTTREYEVADKCRINCCPHQLRFMSEVESWNLLQNKVFRSGISPLHLHEIGKLIAKSCKGLPLSVIVIAGLLARTEKDLKWWNEIAERVLSYLSDEGCTKILELSYMRFPMKLKPCLLYLGAFPEDMLISVKQVSLLWIAEGFIEESNTENIIDVAKEYFSDLVSRSFIIVRGRGSNGEINKFCVHDLIRAFCQTKCQDANFFQLDHGTEFSSCLNSLINNPYRLSMHNMCAGISIDTKSMLSKARSLLLFDTTVLFELRDLRLTQVFSCDDNSENYNLQYLSSLVHLRHIDAAFSDSSSIYIPSSISNVWSIGSLILVSCFGENIHLPDTFWRMKTLRHVKVDRCILNFSDSDEHLDKVISFSQPILSTVKDVQKLLQRLPSVRKLSCILDGCFDYDGLVETIDFQRKLESLTVDVGEGGRWNPYSIIFPSTLKKLTLWNFLLFPQTVISRIAELHCLKVLKLRRISILEQRLEMEGFTFQSLIFFELYAFDLVEWNASIESLPSLEQLVIKCPKLEELPFSFGESSTLKRIVLRDSNELVERSALRIQDEQMELGNEVEVVVR